MRVEIYEEYFIKTWHAAYYWKAKQMKIPKW